MIINTPEQIENGRRKPSTTETAVQETIILAEAVNQCDKDMRLLEQLRETADDITAVLKLFKNNDGVNDALLQFIDGTDNQICRVCGWDQLPSADEFPVDEVVEQLESSLERVNVEMEAFGLKMFGNLVEAVKRYARKGDKLGAHAARLKEKGKGEGFDVKLKKVAKVFVDEGMDDVADKCEKATRAFAGVLKDLDKLTSKEKVESKDVKPIRKKAIAVANQIPGVEVNEATLSDTATPERGRMTESTPKDMGIDSLDDGIKMLETLVDAAENIADFYIKQADERTFKRIYNRMDSDESRKLLGEIMGLTFNVVMDSVGKAITDARKIGAALS